MRTVSPQEIEQLYAFTVAHFIDYYDLQTELVDHLANDIEAIWQKHPTLTFEQARDQSFKKFGVFGFMEVAEHRQKAMTKRYLRFFLKALKQWFSLPKVLTTSALFILFYVAFSSSIAPYLAIASYGLLIVFGSYKVIILRRHYKLRQKEANRKWLLEDLIFKQTGAIGLFVITQQFTLRYFSEAIFDNFYANIGLALLFTLLYLIVYIAFIVLPNKAESLLAETYPEYSL